MTENERFQTREEIQQRIDEAEERRIDRLLAAGIDVFGWDNYDEWRWATLLELPRHP